MNDNDKGREGEKEDEGNEKWVERRMIKREERK